MSSPFSGVDHVGYVVTDLDQAIRFATEVLGFSLEPDRQGNLADPDGETLVRRFGVPARAQANYRFVYGGVPVEFLQWSAPDQSPEIARNCDLSGRHLAVKVTDMATALERIGAFPGVDIREPNPAGFIYVKTPFGLEVQLIPVQGAS